MAEKKVTLTVALAVYNEASYIGRCLSSIASIADEIVVVDGTSTDNTPQLAKDMGAHVIVTPNLPMFHINKQKALDASHGDWILQLDADEVVDTHLCEEIRDIIKDPHSFDAYDIPRRNYFLGDWLRKGGQYPDRVIRLFRRGKGKFPKKSVHEQIEISGSLGHLRNPLDHYSYVSVSQYWKKSSSYIKLTAEELVTERNHRSIGVALSYLVIRPTMTFLALYIRHKGFMDGWRGFVYALFSAMHFPKAYLVSRQKKQNVDPIR